MLSRSSADSWYTDRNPSGLGSQDLGKIREILRANVVALMSELDMSQVQLAQKMGRTEGAISKLCKRGSIDIDALGELASALQVEVPDLFMAPGTQPRLARTPVNPSPQELYRQLGEALGVRRPRGATRRKTEPNG